MDVVLAALIVTTGTVVGPLLLARQTNRKLEAIHALTDGNLTVQIEARLDATEGELALMYEIMELKAAGGHRTNGRALARIEATEAKVETLKAQLADRAQIEET